MIFYGHPLSSYCWKALIALWELGVDFDYCRIDDPANAAAWQRTAPFGKMPLLIDGDTVVPEAMIIIEHVQIHRPGRSAMIPAEPPAALQVRLLDRLSDNYLMAPMQAIVAQQIRPDPDRDPIAIDQAHAMLDTAYRWWNDHMAGREWAAGSFGLADCAAAPALFYADWIHPIGEDLAALGAYRARLLARPSVARAVDEARPFRHLFPFGDPGRD